MQALLNMTPHLDKQTRKHRFLFSLQGFFRAKRGCKSTNRQEMTKALGSLRKLAQDQLEWAQLARDVCDSGALGHSRYFQRNPLKFKQTIVRPEADQNVTKTVVAKYCTIKY